MSVVGEPDTHRWLKVRKPTGLVPFAGRRYPGLARGIRGIGARWTSATEGTRIRPRGVLPQLLSVITSLKTADVPGLRIYR